MDIQNNKNNLQVNIKRLALKTTASALLSLNAETVIAASCPTHITGSALAGLVCDFDITSSVTVESGGTVGGINMNSYTPLPPSFIAIKAGGVVGNSDIGGVGIAISNSLLSNGLSNAGTISSTNGFGITISNTSTVSGGINNSGVINTSDSSILINHSIINDGLSNSGIINSTSGSAIYMASSSTINGSLSNSGIIRGGGVNEGIAILNQSTLTGSINNSGLIEASGNGDGIILFGSSSIHGSINNSGTIRSVANDGIAINISNVGGNITNSGIISGGNRGLTIHNASMVGGSIINGGTITGDQHGISIFSATTISGNISNSGTISGGQNGLSIASSVTINGGISNSGTIQGNIFAINIDSSSFVSNIDIIGQSARIIGAVEAATTIFNVTSGAVFTSEGSYDVNIFNIASNAVFNMANQITANLLNNSGTLAITESLQTIIGDYTQQTGGLFQTGVSSSTNYGQLAVSGAVDLSQSGNIYVQVSQNSSLKSGDILANVINGNTLLTPMNGFNITDNSYILTFTPVLNNTNTGVNLITGINPGAFSVCQGTYCEGAANTIIGQVAAGNPLFSPYAALPTASALQIAASQATPELINENNQVVQLITRAVLGIAPIWDNLHGKSSSNLGFSFAETMPYQPGDLWIKPYGAAMTQNKRNTVDGFNATAYGVAIGKDIELTKDWIIGSAFAAGGDTLSGKSVLSNQSIHSNAYQGLLYAAKKFPNHIYFAGQSLIGYESNESNRFIPLYASISTGSFNSWFTNLRAELGWNTYNLSPNLVFTPFVDASYLYINQSSYQESGSPMDLLVAANNNSSLVLGAYGNAAYYLQNYLRLQGYAGLAGNVINSQPQVNATFVTGGPSFSTFGVAFNELVFRGGVGLALTSRTQPVIIELNYDLQAGNNAYSNIGAATIKYRG